MFPKNVLIVEILLSDMFEWCLLRPFAQKKGKLFPENVHEMVGVFSGACGPAGGGGGQRERDSP